MAGRSGHMAAALALLVSRFASLTGLSSCLAALTLTTGIRSPPPFSPAAAHEGSELPVAALQQTHLIAASSHAEQQESREWFCYPPGRADAASGHGAPAGSEEGRVGPVSKAEIRQLYRWARSRGGVAITTAQIRLRGGAARQVGRPRHGRLPAVQHSTERLSVCFSCPYRPASAAPVLSPLRPPSGLRACLSPCRWPLCASCGGGWHASKVRRWLVHDIAQTACAFAALRL